MGGIGKASPKQGGPIGSEQADRKRLLRFLRSSHIFSSAVREILEARFFDEVSPHPLTVQQFHLLKLIALNGPHKVGKVAEFLGVSSPAVTKNIDKLKRLGLVRREPDYADRRSILLTASPLGRDLVRRYEDLKAARLRPVLECFEPEEIDQLSELLVRLSTLLFERERPPGTFCLRCAAYCERDCPVGQALGHCPYDEIRSRAQHVEAERGRHP